MKECALASAGNEYVSGIALILSFLLDIAVVDCLALSCADRGLDMAVCC